jgi:hypothetical protein
VSDGVGSGGCEESGLFRTTYIRETKLPTPFSFFAMSSSHDRSISIVEAARFIFRTRAPTEKQLRRVYEQMKAGALRVLDNRGPPLRWTTTESALADYLAGRQLDRARSGLSPSPKCVSDEAIDEPVTAALPDHLQQDAERLRALYQGVWRDFFLAIMLRRRMAHRSKSFHRSVFAAQVAMLVAMVGIIFGTIRFAWTPVVAERVAIENYLAEQTDRYMIERWFPTTLATDGAAQTVRVQYGYAKDSSRVIHTDRTFQVRGTEVTEVNESAE